jgi:hypothetical protein
VINGHLLLGGGVDIGDNVANSARFRATASPSLSRTFVAGNQQTWTLSMWVKRGKIGAYQNIFGVNASSPDQKDFRFNADDTLFFYVQTSASTIVWCNTVAVYRDISAWYHLVLAIDTTQTVAADRIKLYVNGVSQAFASPTYPAQNTNLATWNTAVTHYIGTSGRSDFWFDGYMADVNFVNGVATPSSFGRTSPDTGAWVHKNPSGLTYGTNGFRLQFNSVSVASDFGTDTSGNSNTFTVTNLSATAGVTYDWMSDTPTNNYCVLNAIDNNSNNTLSAANLNYSIGANTPGYPSSTFFMSSEKWYWEVVDSGTNNIFGVCPSTVAPNSNLFNATGGYGYYANGQKYVNGTASAYGASFTTNDVIGVALDLTGNTITFYKNNASQGSIGITSGLTWKVSGGNGASATASAGIYNFGQRPFTYTPPTGFSALNTANLSTPTIIKGNKWFDIDTFTATGSTQNRTGFQFQPDFWWGKSRNAAYSHFLVDAVRGRSKGLFIDASAEVTSTAGNDLASFNSDGYTAGPVNQSSMFANTTTDVAWMWKANGTGVSNTAGSITSTVSAGTLQGFSIVTYTGTNANATVGHGLGVAPSMMIFKNRPSSVDNWQVYHVSLGNTQRMTLNSSNAADSPSPAMWNTTSPTSSVFSVGAQSGVNGLSNAMVAYCFSEVAGFSKFGSYTGNGSDDGPFVWCGFRPRFILFKRTDSASDWRIHDTSRAVYNADSTALMPNLTNVEDTGSNVIDVLSNGFKCRDAGGFNVSSATYIFAAFAELPFKYANAR